MKYITIIILVTMSLVGCAGRRYQACAIATKTGEIVCGIPQTRQGAEMKALVVNATSEGQAVAWTQRTQATPKVKPVEQ